MHIRCTSILFEDISLHVSVLQEAFHRVAHDPDVCHRSAASFYSHRDSLCLGYVCSWLASREILQLAVYNLEQSGQTESEQRNTVSVSKSWTGKDYILRGPGANLSDYDPVMSNGERSVLGA